MVTNESQTALLDNGTGAEMDNTGAPNVNFLKISFRKTI